MDLEKEFEPVTNNEPSTNGHIENRPKITDPEWQDYVISQFQDYELVDGKPKVDGLRRVVEKLLGPIVSARATVIQPPNPQNDSRAVVSFRTKIKCVYEDSEAYFRVYEDVADAYHGNTFVVENENYHNYPTALAATRAEGRTYRKALKLSKIVAAEEVSTVPDISDEPENIQSHQIAAFGMHGKRLDIDIQKFINMGKSKFKKLSDIPYSTATQMLSLLNKYQQKRDLIPEEIKGFKKNYEN